MQTIATHPKSAGAAGRRARRLAVCVPVLSMALAVNSVQAQVPAQVAEAKSPRIVAVADIHGAFDELVELLQVVGIIDETLAWVGGDTTLVQTGDITDRGARVREALDLLMRLQEEAPAHGGKVAVVLGNHEVMNLAGELRDVTDEIMESFVDGDAEEIVRDAYREYEKAVVASERDMARLSARERRRLRDSFEEKYSAGRIEYMRALGPDGVYGQWLREQDAIHREGDVTFMHAGVSVALEGWDTDRIVERVGEEIAALDRYRAHLLDKGLITDFAHLGDMMRAAAFQTDGWDWLDEGVSVIHEPPSLPPSRVPLVKDPRARFEPLYRLNNWYLLAPEGPLWFRGYSTWTDDEVAAFLPVVLQRLQARAIVVGHTPQGQNIRSRADGQLYLIDTGMLASVYNGRASALVLENGSATAVYADGSKDTLASVGLAVGQPR